MLSYLAGSSTTPDAAKHTNTQLQELKQKLEAIPSALVSLHKSKRNKEDKGKLKHITSVTYNPSASRPLRRPRQNEQIYRANLRYDVLSYITTSTVATVYVAQSFAISSFSNSSEYLGLFDQYMIEELEVWLEPVAAPGVATTNVGMLCTTVDLDDAATPTTFAQVEDKQSSITSSGINGHYHRWKPNMAVAVFSGAFTSFASSPAFWIDSGSPNVQHYGLKATSTNTSAVISYNLSVRARFAFKQAGI